MHAEGFAHRDIHMRNIMTGNKNEYESEIMYIIDIGESNYLDETTPGHDVYEK